MHGPHLEGITKHPFRPASSVAKAPKMIWRIILFATPFGHLLFAPVRSPRLGWVSHLAVPTCFLRDRWAPLVGEDGRQPLRSYSTHLPHRMGRRPATAIACNVSSIATFLTLMIDNIGRCPSAHRGGTAGADVCERLGPRCWSPRGGLSHRRHVKSRCPCNSRRGKVMQFRILGGSWVDIEWILGGACGEQADNSSRHVTRTTTRNICKHRFSDSGSQNTKTTVHFDCHSCASSSSASPTPTPMPSPSPHEADPLHFCFKFARTRP